jgi:cytochrome c oxidase subunit 4
MLVVLFFMHVKYEANWKYVLTIPAAFMSLFLILALVPDVGLRGHWVSEERAQNMAEPRSATNTPARHGGSRHDDSADDGHVRQPDH